jgi:hypothetical protein
LAVDSVLIDLCPQRCDVSAHEPSESVFDGGEVLVRCNEGEQWVGAGRQMGEMITRGSHDKVKVAVGFLAISPCHDGFQRSRRLFESNPGLRSVSAHFE